MKKSARRDRTRSKHSTLFSLFLLLFPPLLSSRSFFNMPRARTHTRDVQRCCPFKYFSLRLTSWPLYLEKYSNFAWSAQQLTLSVPYTISFFSTFISFSLSFLRCVACCFVILSLRVHGQTFFSLSFFLSFIFLLGGEPRLDFSGYYSVLNHAALCSLQIPSHWLNYFFILDSWLQPSLSCLTLDVFIGLSCFVFFLFFAFFRFFFVSLRLYACEFLSVAWNI